jgi:hypothetical protein
MAVAIVIDVAGGLSALFAQRYCVRLLSLLVFGRRFSRQQVLEILLRNRAAAAHAIDHFGLSLLRTYRQQGKNFRDMLKKSAEI